MPNKTGGTQKFDFILLHEKQGAGFKKISCPFIRQVWVRVHDERCQKIPCNLWVTPKVIKSNEQL